MRVLLVEDNRPLADWLAKALRQSRFVVDCMHDGADADHVLRTQDQQPGRAQFFGIVNALGIINGIAHKNESSLPCMCVRPACRMPQTETGRTKRHTYFI